MKELEVIQKTISKARVKELSKKKDLSVDDALLVLSYYDTALKEAGKFRTKDIEQDDIKRARLDSGENRMLSASVLTVISFFVAGTAVDPLFLIGILAGAVPSVMSLPDNILPQFKEKISSRKAKRKVEDLLAQKRLYELKEQEYGKFAQKVLKKAAPALEIINASLPVEEFVYISENGSEGFELKPKNFTKWEKAKIGILQAESPESLPELEPTKISLRKEIGA